MNVYVEKFYYAVTVRDRRLCVQRVRYLSPQPLRGDKSRKGLTG